MPLTVSAALVVDLTVSLTPSIRLVIVLLSRVIVTPSIVKDASAAVIVSVLASTDV